VHVSDVMGRKLPQQQFELGVVARARIGSHIDKQGDSLRFKDGNKFIERACGMANGVEYSHTVAIAPVELRGCLLYERRLVLRPLMDNLLG
jgi:hypothetical protein